MKLADFCGNYPSEQENWHNLKLAKALPVHLREILHTKIGSLFAANDLSRAKNSSRLGLALRPFQPGDRIKAISLGHFMRTDEIMTRIDNAQGQLTARIFCITTRSLDYQSEAAACTKGQIMLGVAAVLETLHQRQNHRIRICFCPRDEFAIHLAHAAKSRQGAEAIYVLSDFLNGSLQTDFDNLLQAGYTALRFSLQFFCIRDAFERANVSNPLQALWYELTDFAKVQSARKVKLLEKNHSQVDGENSMETGHFSGSRYVENLVSEMEGYRSLLRNHQCAIQNIEESTSLDTLIQTLRDTELMQLRRN